MLWRELDRKVSIVGIGKRRTKTCILLIDIAASRRINCIELQIDSLKSHAEESISK